MKKVSLKSVKSYLNRDEMRMISGGYSGTASCKTCSSNGQCGTNGQLGACVTNKFGCPQGVRVCL